MSRSAYQTATSSDSAAEIRAARKADYVAFLHRAPFAIDAANMEFLTGYREDCSYQQRQYLNLERYIERFKEYEPHVGVLGDAYSVDEAHEYVRAARTL